MVRVNDADNSTVDADCLLRADVSAFANSHITALEFGTTISSGNCSVLTSVSVILVAVIHSVWNKKQTPILPQAESTSCLSLKEYLVDFDECRV
ncbi:hypothetical protein EGR_03512 [Echinococcus granulosus]|uniref:Uncharacterized protein n=1 Tax=Echinococcus granulosus TaxID=6210 RepID=W6UKU1_ECHGR|nr:hypothetical protein EGR_03512 [Echinococcus granulosus]EUB61698.1 hypothetical protein EGR_03512 [Echinococcus granulosus]